MRLTTATLLAVLLVACKKDVDNDGYPAGEDCNDNNDAVNPGAVETCDGIDNNCDGNTDEDLAATFFADIDGDGFGDANNKVESCDQPSGYTENSDDCNDTSEDFYPGAPEDDCSDPNDYNCDGSSGYEDNDGDNFAACEECDDSDAGVNPDADEVCDPDDTDENCDGIAEYEAVDAGTWYIDYDNDGYGSPTEDYIKVECDQPDGYVDNDGDCDDTSDQAAPGGDEVCDGLDNDCNGVVDGADAADAQSYYADADGDGFGDESSLQVTCDVLDDVVLEAGDCDDGDGDINPDAEEVCNDGVDNNCIADDACFMDLTDADVEFYGIDAEDQAGYSADGAGDINNDGYADLIIGGWRNDEGDTDAGAAYLAYGPITSGDYTLDEVSGGALTGFAIIGEESTQAVGRSVAGVGDVDGDGRDDFIVSATLWDEGATDAGGAALFLGNSVGTADQSFTDADLLLAGESKTDYAGGYLNRGGDTNNDGYMDFLVGAINDDDGGGNAGAVYLILGSSSIGGEQSLGDSEAKFTAEAASDKAGLAMDTAGDLNGDGNDDVVIGVRLTDPGDVTDAGTSYLMLGPATGSISMGDAEAAIYGDVSSDRFGETVASTGDHNGDSYDDVLIAATLEDTGGSQAGAVYLIQGTATVSSLDGLGAGSAMSIMFYGGSSSEAIGNSLAGGSDLNGDGELDFVIGGASAGISSEGEAYVFFGPLTSGSYSTADADATLAGDTNSDAAGNLVRIAGDVNGTGTDALLVGAREDDANGTDAGAVYLLHDLGL